MDTARHARVKEVFLAVVALPPEERRVALDQACADAVNAQKPVKGSLLDRCSRTHGDYSLDLFPETDWKGGLEHAEQIGFGTRSYRLIKV